MKKKLFRFFVSLIPLSAFAFAQDTGPKLETILGNQFSLTFMPTYTHDSAIGSEGVEIKKQKPDFIPSLWDRIKFTLKYDKVLWHTRVEVATGNQTAGYTVRLDRSYINYSPIEGIKLEAGLTSSLNTISGVLSENNDEVTLPLTEGKFGSVSSLRNMGLWLFYNPVKNITVTPYLLAPKTTFTTPGVRSTLLAPGGTSVPLFTTDSTERYAKSDTTKVPYFGLALEGYFLDKAIYLAGYYETSFLAQHTFFGSANLSKKEDWRSAFWLEGSVNLGQFNVSRQRSLNLGTGYIAYFGPDNRHELQLQYILSLTNPNSDGRLYKTPHKEARAKALGFDQNLQNTYYDLHDASIEGKFRVYSGDQLFFVVGVDVVVPGKKLGSINKKADGTLVIPLKVSPQFSIHSSL